MLNGVLLYGYYTTHCDRTQFEVRFATAQAVTAPSAFEPRSPPVLARRAKDKGRKPLSTSVIGEPGNAESPRPTP